MPLPRALARFNRRVTNPIQRTWAGWLPAFGIIEHTGRRTGRVYRTPVNLFRAPGGFVVLVDYGPDSDWVRNLRAAGTGQVVHRGRRYRVSDPELLGDGTGRELLPRPVRLVSRLGKFDHVVRMRATPD